MKKHSILALVLLGVISLGCVREEIPGQARDDVSQARDDGEGLSGDPVTVTTTITLPDAPATKALTAAGVKTFAPDDKVVVVYTLQLPTTQEFTGIISSVAFYTLSAEDISNGGKSASISVSMVNPISDGKVRVIYPANMFDSSGLGSNEPDDDSNINYAALATQDGTLASLAANLDLAVFDGHRVGYALPASIQLENRLAIGEFTVKDDGSNDITSSITRFTVSDGTDTYTVSRAAGPGPIYVAMKPVSGDLKITATDDSEGYYIKDVSAKTLDANKMYPIAVNMHSATPLTFEAITAGAQVSFDMYVAEGTVQYKLNDGGWINYTSKTPITLSNVGDKVQFRGNNSTYGDYYPNYSHFTITDDCYLYGNIMSLLTDFDTDEFAFAENVTLTGQKNFYSLFEDNPNIKSHGSKPLVLPATTLTELCYHRMFMGCTGLTTAPALPATTMTYCCYYSLFSGCTGLTTAPALPATTLAQACYCCMFYGCTGLTTAPELPATTLAFNSYASMFNGCTSLTTAPALSATNLDGSCYANMFQGCTSLTTAPALPATTLYGDCYANMFQGCTSLTTAPALPATTLASSCYASMFSGCTSLTTAPALPATTLELACYAHMFERCTSLTTAPALPATTLSQDCYAHMFERCTSLTTAPALPATTLAYNCYANMFQGCTSLTTAPALPATTLDHECYVSMFRNCENLSIITCLAEEIWRNSTSGWLCGVSSSGTFTKAENVVWPQGDSGIPSGWTVVDYVAPNP